MAKKIRKKNFHLTRQVFSIAGLIIIMILIIAGFYFYRQYKESEFEIEGVVICNEEGICERSLHIHAEFNLKICQDDKDLPKEKGRLSWLHTHKEKNLLHFHERLRVDPETHESKDAEPLTIKTAVAEILGMKLTDECIGNFCNGIKCPSGRPGTLQLFVNGQLQEKIADYVWKDKDKIDLTFD